MADYFHPLVEPFRLDGDRDDAVVLLHGWTGSPAHLRPLGAKLNQEGYTVLGPLLAGHGTTLEQMAKTVWRDWVQSALEPTLELAAEGKTLHLVGLSMGGIISILLAPVLDALSVTTINAPIVTRDRRIRMSGMYRGSDRIDLKDPPLPAPDGLQEYQVQYDGSPVGTIAELHDLMTAARRNLGQVTCPTLVIQSKVDETVHPKSADIIYDGLGTSQKGLVWLEEARHVAVLDTEADVITEAVVQHLADAAG